MSGFWDHSKDPEIRIVRIAEASGRVKNLLRFIDKVLTKNFGGIVFRCLCEEDKNDMYFK